MKTWFPCALLIVVVAVTGCGPTPSPTATPVPPTPVPPTATPLPPLPTPVLLTVTPAPTTDTVCADGCDFTTIQAAIDAESTVDGAAIEIVDPVHTEAGIVVEKSVTIRGLGADATIVQAHETPGEALERVFFVEQDTIVVLEKMTIRHGKPSDIEEDGAGVRNFGTLTISECVITANEANGGGGIASSGTLVIVDSTITNNDAYGIAQPGLHLECGCGGGIKCGSGTLTLINSTVSDNHAGEGNRGAGGGVNVGCGCVAALINSTISGNESVRFGGGIHTRGAVQLANCTISNNTTGEGGGIYVGPGGRLDYENTIIAGNSGGHGNCYLSGPASQRGQAIIGANSNNLVADGSCDSDLSGDPMLDSLADNGGPTLTHALLPGSPAIDALPADSCIYPTDQRGVDRPRVQTSADTPCDIGAFEVDATP
jgi:hypothetical protein